MEERIRGRVTFDRAAKIYHRARPRYPEPLLDSLELAAGLVPGSRLLEIGPATGVATEQLARLGHRITAVEMGAELAVTAERNLAAFDVVDVVNAPFETWEPPRWAVFDAVVAATCWHWLDPDVRYERVHRHLRPGGHLAFWSAMHVFPDDGDSFFVDLQEVYDEIDEGLGDNQHFPRPGELPVHTDELAASGLFDLVSVEHFDWEVLYDADGYLDLLDTFSGHITMARWQRDRLYAAIRARLGARSDGLLRRHWGAVLHVARRR